MVEISLSVDELEGLLLALGYATGAAGKNGDLRLRTTFVRVINAVGRNRPGFVPYWVSET